MVTLVPQQKPAGSARACKRCSLVETAVAHCTAIEANCALDLSVRTAVELECKCCALNYILSIQ